MQSFEIGILPESVCFSFSPDAKTREMFYYPTMCGHFYCNEEYYIKRDSFHPLLLVYVCEGAFHLELDRGNYTARKGQVLFFDCRQPHYYYADGPLEFYYVHFDGPQAHAICQYINRSSGVCMDGKNNEQIRQALEDLIAFYEQGNSESVMQSSQRMYQLLALLDDPVLSPRLQKNDDSINRAIAYIRANVGKRITLHELAAMSGLSDYYFSHLFKEMTGFSPSNFMIYARIDQAKSLLTTTNLSVAQIAKQIGYPNSSNLIVQFTRRVGCSPAQFREENIGANR